MNFSILVPYPKGKEKQACMIRLTQVSVSAVLADISATRHFSEFICYAYPKINSFTEIDRDVLEAYFIRLNTADGRRESYSSELKHLKSALTIIGKITETKALTRLFLPEDFTRTGTVDYQNSEWTTFKELVQGKDFVVKATTKHIRMDFDMKRKPGRDSFYTSTVTIEGETYEIANFTTVPFRTVTEFKEYRQRKATVSCLRTMDDWNMFWFKTDAKSTNVKVRDIEWAILNSCIMGHRAGFWNIPKLDELQGADRDAWINTHNTSTKVWKPNDWKNAGRNSRQANMLPRELIKEKLQELMND